MNGTLHSYAVVVDSNVLSADPGIGQLYGERKEETLERTNSEKEIKLHSVAIS